MSHKKHHVVIIGGGFGGLYAAQQLKNAPVEITLIDRQNYHLFQPLLYQVATGGLSPGDIASPLRAVLNRQENITVLQAEVIDLDPESRQVHLGDAQPLVYDTVIVATGVRNHYFGNDDWAAHAPGLKGMRDALTMRQRIFNAFEAAEKASDPAKRAALLTFVVVGGGPTGVELAGALAELAHTTLRNDFRRIDPTKARILLLEGADRILPPYQPKLSGAAQTTLQNLGVIVETGAMVTDIQADALTYRQGETIQTIATTTVLWGAGMRGSKLGQVLATRTTAGLDRMGRIIVEPDLSLPEYPNILIVGDLAHFTHQTGQPLPGIAPVAMQQGRYAARAIEKRLNGQPGPPFHYQDKGSLAVIGRNAAVAQVGGRGFSGFPAWVLWIFIHLWYLIEFDNKVMVLFQWFWNYLTRKRGARLIIDTEKT